jgi:hypothetical protein
MSLNLIDHALQYAKEARIEEESQINVVSEPLFPEAKRSVQYLRIRENLNRGCRKAVKIIPENWKRSIAYSILMEACYDIFHLGKDPKLITYYNTRLDAIIGTH